MDIFEKASRLKLRFASPKGLLSIEDLWDIPLTNRNGVNLDKIAQGLRQSLRESTNESFVVKSNKADEILQLQFDIVKYIIDVRLAEEEMAEKLKVDRQKKQRIMAIIAEKEDQSLMGKSLEELKELANSL